MCLKIQQKCAPFFFPSVFKIELHEWLEPLVPCKKCAPLWSLFILVTAYCMVYTAFFKE